MKTRYLVITLITFISYATAQTDKRLKGIEKEFNSVLESTKAPGFAVAIVEGDKIIYAKGFGYASIKNKRPVTTNTLFQAASITKTLTSAATLKVLANNQIALEFFKRDLALAVFLQVLFFVGIAISTA